MKKALSLVLSLVLVLALLLPMTALPFTASAKSGDGSFVTPIIPIDSGKDKKEEDPTAPPEAGDPIDVFITEEEGFWGINDALYAAKKSATAENPYVIHVESGVYVLERAFHIFSNTSIVADLNTLFVMTGDGEGDNMLKVGDVGEDSVSGYGYENIHISGGDWNMNGKVKTMFKFCHGRNCSIENVLAHNIKDAHFVEVAGVDGFSVKNCNFYDMTVTVADGREAIQIDVLQKDHIAGYVHLDDEIDYLCKNIVIDGCTFKGTRRAIGSHTVVQGKYFENVAISNNKFINTVEKSILCYNLKNLTITGNEINGTDVGIELKTMDKTGAGTYLSATTREFDSKANIEALNAEIANNTIVSKSNHAIIINGIILPSAIAAKAKTNDKVPAGEYYVENVNIHDNILTAHGKFCPVKVQFSKNVTVANNTVTAETTSETPIYITDGSTAVSVTQNAINSTVLNGIRVCNFNSGATYPQCQIDAISENRIAAVNSSGYGIRLSDANVTAVESNTIVQSGNLGIQADKNVANVKVYVGKINNNTIGTSKTAIKLMKAEAGQIAGNKLSACKQHSIQIDVGSVVKSIKNNTVPTAGQTGIVVKSAKVTEIYGNKITNPKQMGIQVYESSTVGKIASNTISGAKVNGIVLKKSKATEISANTVTNPAQTGIYCYEGATADKIVSNTVSGAKQNGINVNIGVVKAIETNVIKNCKNIGIYLNGTNKTQVNSIKGNRIQSCTIAIKILKGPKANLYVNTLTKNGNSNKIIINGTKQYKLSNLGQVSSVAAKKSGKTIKLSWKKKSTVSAYIVYRSTNAKSAFAKLGTAGAKATSFVDKKPKAKTTYYYRLLPYYKIPGSNVTQYANYTQSKGAKI